MATAAQTRATNKYIKNHTRRFTLQCNIDTEADIIEFLESSGNFNKVMKELIRKEIQESQK